MTRTLERLSLADLTNLAFEAPDRPMHGEASRHRPTAHGVVCQFRLARRYFRRQRAVNVLETDVIGPPLPVYALGARVLDVVAIAVIAGNVPITFCAFSYAGRLTVTAHADADRLLVSGMEVGWDRLANETRAAGE